MTSPAERSSPLELYFDRGTIVVEPGGERGIAPGSGDGSGERGGGWRAGEPLLERAAPGRFLWDPRVDRRRAPAMCLPELVDALDRLGVSWRYASPRPERFELSAGAAPPPLRAYQQRALEAWTAAGRRGIVSLPTGAGKTRIAVRAILALGAPAIVVVPTRQLLHQWRQALAEFHRGPIGILGDGERDVRPLTVATYQSAHIFMDTLGSHFDLLVVDEAHHLAADWIGELAQMSAARHRLGLTATLPEQPERRAAVERLLGEVCYALPIASLAGEYLASFELRKVQLRLSPEEQLLYERHREVFLLASQPFISDHPTASWEDFARAANRTAAGRRALASHRAARALLVLPRCKLEALDVLLETHRDDPTLVFTAENRAAYEISRRFLVPAITCEIEREERVLVLGRFRDRAYRALVSARVLDEGIDVPAASVAIIAGGSSQPRQQVQRVGRVLRPAPGKRAVVYELVILDTAERLASRRRNRRVLEGAAPL